MRWFEWNPSWVVQGASLWAVAAKIAYVTSCTVGTVLKFLLGASEAHRLPIWAAGPLDRAKVCQQLELRPHHVDGMFLGEAPTELEARSDISLQLRWCPICAQRWHHDVHFQDRRVLRCPWHDVLLMEGCSKCGRPVDPLSTPWHCLLCKSDLAPVPENWLQVFKVSTAADSWPASLPVSHLAYELSKGRVVCIAADCGRAQFDGRPWALKFWQRGQLFEAGSALWDTVLSEHRTCALDECDNHRSLDFCRRFYCPVAGAARAVLDSVASCSEVSGDWPSTAVPPAAEVSLPWTEDVSFELMRAMLRELPRRWLLDALMLFGDLAAARRSSGRWEPQAGPVFSKGDLGGTPLSEARALTSVTSCDIQSAKSFAARLCPKVLELKV